MLVKLEPDQVIREWEVIKYAIQQSTHEQIFDTPDKIRDHLREILIGGMQVWAILEGEIFVGILTTRFSHDNTMGVRRLEIYSLYGYRDIDIKSWVTCFVILKRFARAHNCSYIISLTDQEGLIRLAERFKGDTSQRLIVFEV